MSKKVTYECPKCEHVFQFKDTKKVVKCPNCKTEFKTGDNTQ